MRLNNTSKQTYSEIFISYAWKGESEDMVNKLYSILKSKFNEYGIELVRDKVDLGYKGSIKEFMRRIGGGSYIIVVISKKYLQSKNCMFELLEIAENKNFKDRIYPVVLGDANIYDAVGRIPYLKFWKDKIDELKEAMEGLGQEYIISIQEELNLFSDIRRSIDSLAATIGDMNTLTPQIHIDSDFEHIFKLLLEDIQSKAPVQELGVRIWGELKNGVHKTRDIVMVPQVNHDVYDKGKDIVLCCQANEDCHIAIINIGSSGKKTVLHPSTYDSNTSTKADTVFWLPNPSHPFSLKVQGKGEEIVRVIASKMPFTITEDILEGALPTNSTEAFYKFTSN